MCWYVRVCLCVSACVRVHVCACVCMCVRACEFCNNSSSGFEILLVIFARVRARAWGCVCICVSMKRENNDERRKRGSATIN